MSLTGSQLRAAAAKRGIAHIGWFKPRRFDAYLEALNVRPEYKNVVYRTFEDFFKAGSAPVPEGVKTILVFAVDYFDGRPSAADEGRLKLSNYSRNCWRNVGVRAKALEGLLSENGVRTFQVDVPARAAACLAGLGFIGRNACFYLPGVGSYVGIGCVGCDLEIPEEVDSVERSFSPVCAKCDKCVKACPTHAISEDGYRIDPLRCISMLNRHPEEPAKAMPSDPALLKGWIAGCEICQDVCPLNKDAGEAELPAPASSIDLYGMTLPNRCAIDKAEVAACLDKVSDPHFKRYLEFILNAKD